MPTSRKGKCGPLTPASQKRPLPLNGVKNENRLCPLTAKRDCGHSETLALNPALTTALVSWATVTFSLTLTTAESGIDTTALITPSILASAPCTLATQAPHVMPVTAKLTSLAAGTALSSATSVF